MARTFHLVGRDDEHGRVCQSAAHTGGRMFWTNLDVVLAGRHKISRRVSAVPRPRDARAGAAEAIHLRAACAGDSYFPLRVAK